MVAKSRAVKISALQYDQIHSLSEKTGHKMGFHLGRAISNYLNDEAPVWLQKVEEVEKAARRRR